MSTAKQRVTATHGFDVEKVRQDFPALHQEVRGKPLAYLDNGASAQKPAFLPRTFLGDVLRRIGIKPIRTYVEEKLATRLLHGRQFEELT